MQLAGALDRMQRRSILLLLVACVWAIAGPWLLDYPTTALAWSSRLTGAAALIAGVVALVRGVAWPAWLAGIAGTWMMASPVILWAQTPGEAIDATLTGTLLVGFGAVLPLTRRMPGAAIPAGWSYNPSAWSQRVPVMVLAVLSFAAAAYLAAFQLGHVATVWDPFFGDGTRRVLTSDVSKAWPFPDAGLGAFAYLVDLVMTCAGDRRRWRTMPWMVVSFGILIVPVGIVSIVLVILQPVAVGAWCSWCLFTALATLLMIPLALDEVAATLQVLARERRAGRSAWRVFWRGTDEGATDTPAPPREEGRALPWPLVGAALLGMWLMAAPALLGAEGAAADHAFLAGALVAVVAITAVAEVARPLRLVLVPLAAWIALAALLAGDATPLFRVHGVAVAIALAAISLPRGPVQERHGRFDRVALWPGPADA